MAESFFPKIRQACKNRLEIVSVQQRQERESRSLHYVDPWAFIRVKDERRTLLASLNSILPVIHQGVIGYNTCIDGSDRIIEDFCRRNPGFIPFAYPHAVVPAGSKEYCHDLPFENTLAGYYTAVLNLIPKGQWLIKIDVDQIYFPHILKHSFSLPKNTRETVIYSRLDFFIGPDQKIYVIEYKRPGDDWLIFNEGLSFINQCGYDENNKFFAWEHLMHPKCCRFYRPECSTIHFPYEKRYRSCPVPLSEMKELTQFITQYTGNEISNDVLSVSGIQNIINSFDRT